MPESSLSFFFSIFIKLLEKAKSKEFSEEIWTLG